MQAFKVGPDYLDPTYLTIASGRPCYNLDAWMADTEYARGLFVRATQDADVAIVEGVMGLFDGADVNSLSGSTAEMAITLDAPVILVVNVHGMARTLAALVKGFSEFEPELRVGGVIANHCGSARHTEGLAEALAHAKLPPLVGGITRGAFPALPSRHLGLVTATDAIVNTDLLDSLATALESHVSLDAVLAAAEQAPPLSAEIPGDVPQTCDRVRIGVAYDAAFHFYYQDNLEALERHGAEIVRFSPLSDDYLPDGLDAIYIGGGYPEEHAASLAANRSMMQSVREFATGGKPVYGECGGLMYLGEGIETLDGTYHELVGLVPVRTRMLERLRSLGYAEVTLRADSLFGPEGTVLRGHEFHYSELIDNPVGRPECNAVYETRKRRTDAVEHEGYQVGHVLVSYVHLHFASQPDAVKHFLSTIATCRTST